MLQLLRSRRFAALVMVLALILSICFGFIYSVNKASANVEEQFFTGVTLSDYTQASLYKQLKDRIDYSNTLAATADGYALLEEETGLVRKARSALYDAWEDRDIAAMYSANVALTGALESLSSALPQAGMDADDLEYMEVTLSDLENVQAAIEKSDYNRMVDEYMQEGLDLFPASFLRRFLPVHTPAVFAEN